MIIEAEIINQPYAGEFTERIYDNYSAWNSQSWSSVKFTNGDYTDWCGQFRGFPKQVAISIIHNIVLVLTSDYLFQLERESGNLLAIERNFQYRSLTTTPDGDFIIADYYNLEKINTSIKQKKSITSEIVMDMIEFKQWNNSKLEFTCDVFTNWNRHLLMTFDCKSEKIEIESEL